MLDMLSGHPTLAFNSSIPASNMIEVHVILLWIMLIGERIIHLLKSLVEETYRTIEILVLRRMKQQQSLLEICFSCFRFLSACCPDRLRYVLYASTPDLIKFAHRLVSSLCRFANIS